MFAVACASLISSEGGSFLIMLFLSDLVSDAVPSSDSSLALVIRMTATLFWPDVDSVLPLAIWPLLNLLTFCRRCDSEQVFWLFEDSDDLLLFGDVLVVDALSTC